LLASPNPPHQAKLKEQKETKFGQQNRFILHLNGGKIPHSTFTKNGKAF
jgi:hypothetical protein